VLFILAFVIIVLLNSIQMIHSTWRKESSEGGTSSSSSSYKGFHYLKRYNSSSSSSNSTSAAEDKHEVIHVTEQTVNNISCGTFHWVSLSI
jgi:hypothetical protein